MLSYMEFLNTYFDMDTSCRESIFEVEVPHGYPLNRAEELYAEYVKKSQKIEASYNKYLKKKQDQFRRKVGYRR